MQPLFPPAEDRARRWTDRRALVFIGVSMTAAAGLAYVILSPPAREAAPAASVPWASRERAAPAPSFPAPVANSLTPPSGFADVSDLERLVDAFRDVAQDTAAAKVVRRFADKPELKQRFDEFRQDQKSAEPKDSLLKLVNDLANNELFHQAVAAASQEPGFMRLASALERLPEARQLIHQELARASGGGRAAQASLLSGRRSAAARPSMGARSSSGGFTAFETVEDRRVGVEGGSGAAAHAGAPGSSGGEPAIDGSASSKEGANAQTGASGAEADGYNVSASLNGAGGASSEMMKKLCQQDRYKGFCDGDKIKPQFLALIPYIQAGKGIWGGCFESNIYAQCASACASSPGCVAESAWTACHESFSGDATCVQQCLQRGLCAGDAGYQTAFAQYCGLSPQSWCPNYNSGGGGGDGGGSGDGSGTSGTDPSQPRCSNGCPNPPGCNGFSNNGCRYDCFGNYIGGAGPGHPCPM